MSHQPAPVETPAPLPVAVDCGGGNTTADSTQVGQVSSATPSAITTAEVVTEFVFRTNPSPPDAPVCQVPLTTPSVLVVAVVLAWAIFFPLSFSNDLATDSVALLCLLPSIAASIVVLVVHRRTIHFRQVFVRFAAAWMLMTPIVVFAAFLMMFWWYSITIMLTLFLPDFAAFLAVFLGITICVVAFEETLKMKAVQKFDSLPSLSNPRFYPYYASATALGLASALSYYIALFMRFALDEGQLSRRITVEAFALIVFMSIVLLQPMQLIASYHSSLVSARVNVFKHNVPVSREMVVIVLARSFFIFTFIAAIFLKAYSTFAVSLVVFGGYVSFVKQYEKNMPEEYLNNVGVLNLLGFAPVLSADLETESVDSHTPANPETL